MYTPLCRHESPPTNKRTARTVRQNRGVVLLDSNESSHATIPPPKPSAQSGRLLLTRARREKGDVMGGP